MRLRRRGGARATRVVAPTPPVILTEDDHLAIIGLGGVGANEARHVDSRVRAAGRAGSSRWGQRPLCARGGGPGSPLPPSGQERPLRARGGGDMGHESEGAAS